MRTNTSQIASSVAMMILSIMTSDNPLMLTRGCGAFERPCNALVSLHQHREDHLSTTNDNPLLPTTAGIHPERFGEDFAFLNGQAVAAVLLGVFVIVAFGFRTYQLGFESLGEDEFNKLETVREYREHGLSGKNGEHPFLMKGLQTVSVIAAEEVNSNLLSPSNAISPESALRFPLALFGSFTVLLLYFVVRELFGRSIGLASAALWTVEPMAIGFDRVAKEDSLLLFFFLLTSFLWLRSQTIAERGGKNWLRYVWASAAAFAALMATKYNPWLLSITAGYYTVFERLLDLRKWVIGHRKFLVYFLIMGAVFIVLNPTILIPQTWREMLKFSSENRIGHDSYEYLGQLYPQKMSLWLKGVPWTFYYVFIAVKTSLTTLILCLAGIPLVMRRRMGDGRFFVFLWAALWFLPFTFLGGKFTRYFAIPAPLLMISAGVAFYSGVIWLSRKLNLTGAPAGALQAVLFLAFLIVPAYDSLSTTPHFRLFTNTIGAEAKAGTYFPHDEFYDAASREILAKVSVLSNGPTVIACETPDLFDYYSDRTGVPRLDTASLSDPKAVATLKEGDVVVLTSGRRYLSNDAYEQALSKFAPNDEVKLAGATAARIYKLDGEKLQALRTAK